MEMFFCDVERHVAIERYGKLDDIIDKIYNEISNIKNY